MQAKEKVDVVSLKQFTDEEKIFLIKELGYQTDGTYALDKKGEKIKDKYIDIPIKLSRMLILPGSSLLLDDNELSVTLYLKEYGDPFE